MGGGSKENIFSDSESGIPLWNGEPLLNLVYPVGSLYWSSNDTDPGTLFGGTWQQIKDKFILAAGDSYSVNNTGGAATVALSVDNMPSHDHSFTPSGTVSSHSHSLKNGTANVSTYTSTSIYHYISQYDNYSGIHKSGCHLDNVDDVNRKISITASSTSTSTISGRTELEAPSFSGTSGTTDPSGSGTAHNNMPPYIVKYCWERIA